MMCSPKISVFTGMTHKNVMLNPQLDQLYPVSLCPADDLWDTISLMGEGEGGGGQNKDPLVPPPLHPLPRWGGEFFTVDF